MFYSHRDSLLSKYDYYILMGGFNAELSNNFVDNSCGVLEPKNTC